MKVGGIKAHLFHHGQSIWNSSSDSPGKPTIRSVVRAIPHSGMQLLHKSQVVLGGSPVHPLQDRLLPAEGRCRWLHTLGKLARA